MGVVGWVGGVGWWWPIRFQCQPQSLWNWFWLDLTGLGLGLGGLGFGTGLDNKAEQYLDWGTICKAIQSKKIPVLRVRNVHYQQINFSPANYYCDFVTVVSSPVTPLGETSSPWSPPTPIMCVLCAPLLQLQTRWSANVTMLILARCSLLMASFAFVHQLLIMCR